ncbi:MAG: 3-deoxy-manno-octulosonate cytidylyltransferase [Candidatus Aminicenantes bacterium]|nr:MAG: 3-deoxy-manno-octulosonate cytidylyltransferase [Candidatus Aminicenantes bacterium]
MKLATGIIPARYDSKRFPGKHLAVILGKSIIQRVYEQAQTANLLQRIIIATDDERIFQASQAFGAEVLMTSPLHNSGTERAAEIAEKINTPIIINIQGDEPLCRGKMIDDLVIALQDETIPMATLAAKVKDLSLINEKNIVKAVLDKNGFALYFSRSPLPFQASDYFWQHIGIYGYQRDFLLEFSQLSASRLETTEKLEQLRVLENGYKIKIIETSSPTLSVNTPQDIIRIENFLKQRTND